MVKTLIYSHGTLNSPQYQCITTIIIHCEAIEDDTVRTHLSKKNFRDSNETERYQQI